ncbi:hypothetical protein G3M48_009265 [Beauveria asiatica]|uniref:Uncharacterized protein n=1 Tax=Beauveria asiatica TaxID=1069075 RepID=A0AAW0RJ00_9HYPO
MALFCLPSCSFWLCNSIHFVDSSPKLRSYCSLADVHKFALNDIFAHFCHNDKLSIILRHHFSILRPLPATLWLTQTCNPFGKTRLDSSRSDAYGFRNPPPSPLSKKSRVHPHGSDNYLPASTLKPCTAALIRRWYCDMGPRSIAPCNLPTSAGHISVSLIPQITLSALTDIYGWTERNRHCQPRNRWGFRAPYYPYRLDPDARALPDELLAGI